MTSLPSKANNPPIAVIADNIAVTAEVPVNNDDAIVITNEPAPTC